MCAVQMTLKFYTVDDVAEMLKVDRTTVIGWIRTGELVASRIGERQYRVKETDLLDYLDRKRVDRQQEEEK